MKNLHIKITMFYFFLIIYLINSTPMDAQTFVNREWVQIQGAPDTIQWSSSVINNNNQLITTGNTFTFGQNANILTTAYDEDGNILWQQQWNGPQNGNDYGVAITADDQGIIYVAGACNYTNDSTFDITLIIYDQYGIELKHTAYSGEGLNNIPFAIELDDANNIYIVGTREDPNNRYDYLLLKLTSEGDLLWDVSYDYNSGVDIATSLVVIDNGNKIAVTGGSETTSGIWDYTTVLFDKNGNEISVDRQPSDETDIKKPKDIVKDAQNNFYITGIENNNAVNQIKIMKLGHDLQPQWVHFSTSGYEEGSNSVSVDNNANSYVGGWIEEVAGIRTPLVMKYDTNGNLLWATSFIVDPAKPHAEITRINMENNLINFIGFATDGISSDIFTGQLATDGELNWIRSWTNLGNSIDFPTNIVSHRNNIYVTGRTFSNSNTQWVTVKYSFFELNPAVVTDTINQSAYLDCQVVLKINGNLLNHPFHLNRELQFYRLTQLLHDTIIIQMVDKTGIDFSNTDLKAIKLHWDYTPSDTLSVSRLGDTVRIPDLWNTFILEIPEGFDLPAVRDSLRALPYIVFDADLAGLAAPQNIPNDNLFMDQHSLHASNPNPPFPDAHINIVPAWEIESGKPYIKIAIIDDPVFYSHPDFLNPALQPTGSVIGDGWDFRTNSSVFVSSTIFNIHGTKVAGIIGAIKNNNEGIAGIAGGNGNSNPGVNLLSLGVRYVNPSDPSITFFKGTWIAQAIVKASGSAFNSGYEAHAINCSFVISEDVFFQKDAVLSAFKQGSSIIASRGNYGNDVLKFPACYDDELVLSVGASGTDGTYKRESGFGYSSNPSNGYTTDWGSSYNQVDIIAPGVSELILTTTFPPSPPFLFNSPFYGTSASAPHVTGVVGLLLSRHHPNQGYPNGLSPEDIEYVLKNTATDIAGSPPNTIGINFPPGPDPHNGYGRLNAGAALNLIDLPKYQILHPTVPVFKSQTLHNSNVLLSFGRSFYTAGIHIQKDVVYEADLYQVEHTTNQSIPNGYQVADIWRRKSASYGVHPVNYIAEPDLESKYIHICYIDLANNPITVKALNYFWHIKKIHGTNTSINTYFPSMPSILKASYSILLYNPTADILNREEYNSDIKIFPNPATEYITIDFVNNEFNDGSLIIYDIFGKIVEQRQISSKDQDVITIPVSHLAKGIYLCTLIVNNKRYTQRFCRI